MIPFLCRLSATILLLSALGTLTAVAGDGVPATRPNVLFILIDDHSATLHSVFNANSPVPTPNMQRIADRGTWFSRAYANVPVCCPSRTALLTGVQGNRSGVYDNLQAYRRASSWIARVQTLPGRFLAEGYLVAGYGKIAHNGYLEDDIGDYTPGYYKMFDRPADATHSDRSLLEHAIPGTFNPSWGAKKWWPWAILPDDWDRDDSTRLQQDTEFANHTIDLIGRRHDRPFFVTCGFFRPHTSWTVPQRYFDRFPLDRIEIPPGFRADDLEDVPAAGRRIATGRGEHDIIVKNAQWKKHLQAYYAAISYVDDQIGRVLDALEAGPNNDNTIVVLAADNGWHTGEKNRWSKPTPWEQACRVVFSISVPGLKPQVSGAPVGLIDLYPTLVALCGLPRPATHALDGFDLSPLLAGSAWQRGQPVLSTHSRGTHSLRDERFRYIHYENGEEELYDHEQDTWEWNNLADDARYAAVKKRLAAWLPAEDARPVERVGGEGAD